MNSKVSIWAMTFAAVAAAMALSGCRTAYPYVNYAGGDQHVTGGTQYVGQGGQYVAVSAQPVDETNGTQVQATATAKVVPLRTYLSLEPVDDDAATLCDYLRADVEGVLSGQGFSVVYDVPAELLVYGKVKCAERNSRGSRLVYRGEIDFSVTRSPEVNAVNGRKEAGVVAHRLFDAQGEQARSREEAIRDVSSKMADSVSKWAAESCLKVAGQMEISRITIANAWFLDRHSDYPSLFCDVLTRLDGVYDCHVVSTSNASRTIVVDVLYDRSFFPDGIMNRIYTIEELNVHRPL